MVASVQNSKLIARMPAPTPMNASVQTSLGILAVPRFLPGAITTIMYSYNVNPLDSYIVVICAVIEPVCTVVVRGDVR